MSDSNALRRALGGFPQDSDRQGDNAAIRNALDDVFYAAMDSIYKLPYPDAPAPKTPPPKTQTAAKNPAAVLARPQAAPITPPKSPTAGGDWLQQVGQTFQGGYDMGKGIAQDVMPGLPEPIDNAAGYVGGAFSTVGSLLGNIVDTVAGGMNVADEALIRAQNAGQLPKDYKPATDRLADYAGMYNENIAEPIAGAMSGALYGLEDATGTPITAGIPGSQNFGSILEDIGKGDWQSALFGRPQDPELKQARQDLLQPEAGAQEAQTNLANELGRGNFAGALAAGLTLFNRYGNEVYDKLSPADQLAASLIFDPINLIPGMGIGKVQRASKLDDLGRVVGYVEKAEDLLPKSAIKTNAAKITEAVSDGLKNVTHRTSYVDDPEQFFSTYRRFVEAGKDPKAFGQMLKTMNGLDTVAGNRAARYLQDFSPAIDEVENGFRTTQTILAGGVADAKKLPKEFAQFIDDVKAGHTAPDQLLEKTKGVMALRAQQHMAKQAAKLYPQARSAPANIARRFLNNIKAAEALVYIGLSPFTFARNLINGVTTMALEGVNPLWDAGQQIAHLKKIGQVQKAADMQTAFNMQKVLTNTGQVVREAMGEGGYATSQTGAMGSFMSKLMSKTGIGKPLEWYQRMENGMRARVWTQTYWNTQNSTWRVGKAIKPIDATGQAVLHQYRIDPQVIHDLVEEIGPNEGRLTKELLNLIQGKRGAAVNWQGVADELGVPVDRLRAYLSEADVTKAAQMRQEIAVRVAMGEDKAQVVDEVIAQTATETAQRTAAKTGQTIPNAPPTPQPPPGVGGAVDESLDVLEQQRGALVAQWNDLTKGGTRNNKQAQALLDQIEDIERRIEAQAGIQRPPPDIPPDAPAAPVPEPKLPQPPTGGAQGERILMEADKFGEPTQRVVSAPRVNPIDDIRQRAAQITQPNVDAPLLRKMLALAQSDPKRIPNVQWSQAALESFTPEQMLLNAQELINNARQGGQKWVDAMADLFQQTAQYRHWQLENGLVENVDEILDRMANGDALIKMLTENRRGLNFDELTKPYASIDDWYKRWYAERGIEFPRPVKRRAGSIGQRADELAAKYEPRRGTSVVAGTGEGVGRPAGTSAATGESGVVGDVVPSAKAAPKAAPVGGGEVTKTLDNVAFVRSGVNRNPDGSWTLGLTTEARVWRRGQGLGKTSIVHDDNAGILVPKDVLNRAYATAKQTGEDWTDLIAKEMGWTWKEGEGWTIPADQMMPLTKQQAQDVLSVKAPTVPPPSAGGEVGGTRGAAEAIDTLRQVAQPDENAERLLSADEMIKAEARRQADLLEALLNLWNREDFQRLRLGTDAQNRIMAWARRDVLPAANETRQASTVMADWMDNAVMISRDGETKFDAALGVLSPFQFWRTRFALQSLRRVADKPAMLAWYTKLRDAQDEVQNDPRFPTRLKGMMQLPFPFLPSWAGGGMWYDPLQITTSIDQVFGMNRFEDQVTDAEIAASIRALAAAGTISQTEAANAIANMGGALWDQQKMQMEKLSSTREGIDDFSTMFRPHLPIDILYKLKTDPKSIGVLFPMTRIIRAATGVNVEQPIKQGLRQLTGAQDIPDWDMWEEQRTDRALAFLVGEGQLSERDALLAMVERKGDAYDMARARAQEQMKFQTFSAFGGQLFPEGEKEYYKSKILRQQMLDQAVASLGGNPDDYSSGEKWDIVKANNLTARGTPLGDFYRNNPVWGSFQSVYDEPEAKLKEFLADEIWGRYDSKGKLDKRLMADDLGDEFRELFLSKDTRDMSRVTLDQLGEWARKARGYVPQQDILKVGDFPEVRYGTADQNARYGAMGDERDALFDMESLSPKLDTYHNLAKDDARAYRDVTPDLDAYLDWYGANMRSNPDIAQLLNPDYQQAAGNYVNTQAANNAVTRYAVQNLDNMIRRIGGRQGRGGGASSLPGVTPPNSKPPTLSNKAKQALAQKAQNPGYFIPRDVYEELLAMYRSLGIRLPFQVWLQQMAMAGGV